MLHFGEFQINTDCFHLYTLRPGLRMAGPTGNYTDQRENKRDHTRILFLFLSGLVFMLFTQQSYFSNLL